jgi:hypothetical protein
MTVFHRVGNTESHRNMDSLDHVRKNELRTVRQHTLDESMTIAKLSPDIDAKDCCIADPCLVFLLARTGGTVRSKGEFEVLHVRLICGQRLWLARSVGEKLQYRVRLPK